MFRTIGLVRCLGLVMSASPAGALQVEEVDITWGFDGHVVEGRFNPVSILVTNPEGRPFEGVLEASPVSRLGDIVTTGFSEGAEGY